MTIKKNIFFLLGIFLFLTAGFVFWYIKKSNNPSLEATVYQSSQSTLPTTSDESSQSIAHNDAKIWTWEEIWNQFPELLSQLQLGIGNEIIQLSEQRWEKKVTFDAVGWQDIGLALLKKDAAGNLTGEMLAAIITRKLDQFVSPRLIDPLSGRQTPASITVKAQRSGVRLNAWNTQYETFDELADYVVVGNRYQLVNELKEITIKERDQDGIIQTRTITKPIFEEIYYAPHSSGLHTPALVARGKQYLVDIVAQAMQELRANQVESRTQRGLMVADAVEAQVVRILPLLEHTDHGELLLDRLVTSPQTFERVYVLLGSNFDGKRNVSYSYTVSRAQAAGLYQFTQPTYEAIRDLYPEAELIPSFEQAARDHVNSAKAAILLIDSNRARFFKDIQDTLPEASARWELDFAGYNGNPSRALQAWGEYVARNRAGNWIEGLHKETRQFVEKFRYLYLLKQGQFVDIF